MGIGRSAFLKLSGLALAGLIVDPFQAVATNNDIYVNKKLGIFFAKPANWGFIKVTDFGRLKEEQILGNNRDTLKVEVYEELGDPICVATKYYRNLPENFGVFSTTITLNVTHKSELEDMEFGSFEELIELSAIGAGQILTGFRVLRRYEPYRISGCRFYEYDADYFFEHKEIDAPLKVELKTFRAEHNDFYYDFNYHQSKAQNQLISNREFEKFKQSIKLI